MLGVSLDKISPKKARAMEGVKLLYKKIKEILGYDEIILHNKKNFNEEDLDFYYEERYEFKEENLEKIKNLYPANVFEKKRETHFSGINGGV